MFLRLEAFGRYLEVSAGQTMDEDEGLDQGPILSEVPQPMQVVTPESPEPLGFRLEPWGDDDRA